MLRLSDARMSGTSYGGCLLHCAPEAYVGGPLALVRPATASRWTCRRGASTWRSATPSWRAAAPPGHRRPPRYERGYGWMFSRHILQADQGCDFDFLETSFGAAVPEPDLLIY
jgi:dihydroxyacid dehydratase/phosphogluconate dehydratase